MSTKRIYIEDDYDRQYGKFWGQLGDVCRDRLEFLADPKSFSLVGFTGGEDISPELYGHKNLASGNNADRDAREVLVFEVARKHGIPMTGNCRGAQLLNVLVGGTMVQHLKRPHGNHCITSEGEEFRVTSAHHQMIVPGPGGQILSWSDVTLSLNDMVYGGDLTQQNLMFERERDEIRAHVTEAIYYPEYAIFGVQHHPEWQKIEEEAPQWTLQKIRELCLGQGREALSL